MTCRLIEYRPNRFSIIRQREKVRAPCSQYRQWRGHSRERNQIAHYPLYSVAYVCIYMRFPYACACVPGPGLFVSWWTWLHQSNELSPGAEAYTSSATVWCGLSSETAKYHGDLHHTLVSFLYYVALASLYNLCCFIIFKLLRRYPTERKCLSARSVRILFRRIITCGAVTFNLKSRFSTT